jgi:stage II sporulation protein D
MRISEAIASIFIRINHKNDCPTSIRMMIVKRFFLFLIAFQLPCIVSAEAFASEHIRVAIADNQKTVTLMSASGLETEGAPSGNRTKKMTVNTVSMKRERLRVRSTGDFIRMNGKVYRGWVELRKKKNGLLLVINDLDIEDYLVGVISAEVPGSWKPEALKAQAVAARTYALYQKRTSAGRPYHVLSTEMSQVYNGSGSERKSALRATRETKGLVIIYHGEIIEAFYHSSCGGHTENASELWGIDEPYLRGVDCECQEISPYGLWEKRMSLSKVINALGRIGYRVNFITDMGIGELTPAGRVKTVAIRTADKSTQVPGELLRAALGNAVVPSVFFELEMIEREAVFSGRGRGHGVGLCQWGSQEMALRGYDFRSILSHYYPGTHISAITSK